MKPTAGSSVLCDTTGSLIIPSGTTNERPNTLDRITGAIRFNSTQLQFEGFNGQDFVSLGGVRDVDQDTYVLTEVSLVLMKIHLNFTTSVLTHYQLVKLN